MVELLLFASLVGFSAGLVGIIRPLPSISIKSRGVAGALLGGSLVLFIVAMEWEHGKHHATMESFRNLQTELVTTSVPASPAATSTPEPEETCEFVKRHGQTGRLYAVMFVGPGTNHATGDLIDCATTTLKPDAVAGFDSVYLFNDRAKAEVWNPVTFGPAPDHDGCIGRVYQDEQGSLSYAPKNQW